MKYLVFIVSLNLLNVQRLSSGKLDFTTQLLPDTGDMSCLISHENNDDDDDVNNRHHHFYSQHVQIHCSDSS